MSTGFEKVFGEVPVKDETPKVSKNIRGITAEEGKKTREKFEKEIEEQEIWLRISFNDKPDKDGYGTILEERVEHKVFGSTNLMDSARKRIKEIFTDGYFIYQNYPIEEGVYESLMWPPHMVKEIKIISNKEVK